MADQLLLDEYFTVRSVSSDRYERGELPSRPFVPDPDTVSRLKAQSDDISLELDFNTQLYTVTPESSLGVQLATQLSQQLQDSADYIMHGKVYRIDDGANDRL